MIYKAFSVWDEAAKAFLPPFYLVATAQAVRAFSDCVRDKSHAFARNPHDYTLFSLGSFDDQGGTLIGALPELVVNGLACVAREVDRAQTNLSLGPFDCKEL